ncbi:MAG: membrane dipeptidase [Bryobacterales bacterium]|nr:membrane dipeptidase [Bryobacterales bacterium]
MTITTAGVSERARRLHRDALVFDGHIHMINRQFYSDGDIGDRVNDGQVDLPRLKEGGVDAMLFSIFVTEDYYPPRYETRQALRLLDLALEQIERNSDKVAIALEPGDIERIVASGRIAAVLDIEGSWDLDADPAVLRALYRMGMRAFQLSAHNWTSNAVDSCCSPPKWNGLNEKGRNLVREANRLRMMINISHASDEAIEQALEISTQPLVATHHGLRSVNNLPRLMSDELMMKVAAKRGVIGFQIGSEFHKPSFFEYRRQNTRKDFWDTSAIGKDEASMSIEEIDQRAARLFPMVGFPSPEQIRITPGEWVEVVEKAIAMVGEDFVSLGTDFDGGPTLPQGMRDCRDLALITDAMLSRNWSEERIRKFLGGNLLRVFREIRG